MFRPLEILAAADAKSHVEDARLGEGRFWDEGDDSALEHLADVLWSIGIGKQTFMFFLGGALTLLFFWSYARNAEKSSVPGRWGNFVETILLFLRDQLIRPTMGAAGDKYLPFLTTCFVYILMCNLLGLIPFFEFIGHGGATATGNWRITAGLAICAFVFYHAMGIKEQGSAWTYFKSLFPHVPIVILPVIVVVEIVAHLVRPFALAVRLYANMFAGHTLMAVILLFTLIFTKDALFLGGTVSAISFLGITALSFLELLVAVIQAFVFTFLTTVFLSMAVHPEH